MASNQQRSRILNLVYKLLNAIGGNNIKIKRNGVYRYYDVNKYCLNVDVDKIPLKSVKAQAEKALMDKLSAKINKDGFIITSNGVAIQIREEKDVLDVCYLSVSIY